MNQLNQGARNWRTMTMGLLLCLFALPMAAQKFVVLTPADIGKVVVGTYHYAQGEQGFTLKVIHRLGDHKPWQISLQKTQQFERSPFVLKTTLPATVEPGGTLDIEFGVNYAKSLQQENTISLLAAPMGETDLVNNGIALNLKLTADGVLMFFNDKTKQYTKSLPTFEFVGAGERLMEVVWNGGGSRNCSVKIEDSGRNAFTLVPNAPGSLPVGNGAALKLSSGGSSFFIKYDGAARKGSADLARITFIEEGGQRVVATMIGTHTGGNNIIAAARELLSRDNLVGGYTPPVAEVKQPVKEPVKEPVKPVKEPVKPVKEPVKPVQEPVVVKDPPKQPSKEPAKEPTKEPAKPVAKVDPPAAPVDTSAKAASPAKSPTALAAKPTPSPKPAPLVIGELGEGFISEQVAKDRLRYYHRRFGEDNLIKVASSKFEKNEGRYTGKFHIHRNDSLKNDPNFLLHFIRVKFKAGADSVTMNAGDHAKMLGDTTLMLSISPEDKDRLSSTDSFSVAAEFIPEYESSDGTVSNDSLVFKGASFGRVVTSNGWKYILFGALIAAVVLFFVIGFIVSRRPVSTFRYLRESRYQRERHTANSQRQRVEVETIHIDLARRESDLIQLAFVDRGERLDGRVTEGIEKVRSIAATVPTPRFGGLRRFFNWLYAPFGRKREPKFKSVYYSLRIELPRGSVPQQLRLKDDTGMLLLGTTLTGNVLATDHQDFKFVKRPFNYSLYLDPAEFLDYTGAMKTVSIPFRVIEEPFEGYVITREFNLNLEIAQRF